jgi:hypothetical protein
MRRLRLAILCGPLLLCSAGAVDAQVDQGPPPPPPGQGGQGAGQGQGPTPEEQGLSRSTLPSWSLSTAIGGSYDSNPSFSVGGEPDFATRASVSFGRVWAMRRGGARLGGEVNRPFYNDPTSPSTTAYGLGASLSYAITRRLNWTLGSSAASSLAQDAELITDAGVVLPNVVATTGTASTTLSYALTPRSSLNWSYGQNGVGFESTIFKGGQGLGTALGLTRQLTRTQSIGLTANYSRTFTTEGTTQVQSYTATWQTQFGKGWTFHATGGIRPYTIPGVEGWAVSPAVSTGISRGVGENQTVSLSYDRTIEQAFGLDRTHLVQAVAGSYVVTLGRKLSIEASGSYAYGTYPLLPDLKLIGQLGSASATYRFIENLGVFVSGTVYRREYRPEPPAATFRIGAGLTYGLTWR